MTTVDHLRKAALGLPEVAETTHFGMLAFAVRGRGFVNLTEDGVVQLQLEQEVADEVLAVHPSAERLVRMGTPIGVRVPLGDINGKDLNDLLYRAWASRAPKRLAAAVAAARSGEVPARSDLPSQIGKPATRALLSAGIVTLADVAARSEAELRALHGVGPRAVTILEAALAERGQAFRDSG